jgi:hypothetical protein
MVPLTPANIFLIRYVVFFVVLRMFPVSNVTPNSPALTRKTKTLIVKKAFTDLYLMLQYTPWSVPNFVDTIPQSMPISFAPKSIELQLDQAKI